MNAAFRDGRIFGANIKLLKQRNSSRPPALAANGEHRYSPNYRYRFCGMDASFPIFPHNVVGTLFVHQSSYSGAGSQVPSNLPLMINVQGKTRSGYVIAFVLLVSSFLLIYYANSRIERANRKLQEAQTADAAGDSLRLMLTRAQAYVQQYFADGQVKHLRLYHEWETAWGQFALQLRRLVDPDFLPQESFDQLSWLLISYRYKMSNAISLYQRKEGNWRQQWMAANTSAGDQFAELDQQLAQITDAHARYMSGAFQITHRAATASKIIALLSLLMAVIVICFTWYMYNRENLGRKEALQFSSTQGEELAARITELRRVNEELNALRNNEKFAATGRIARTIAHEVRNPITNISMAVEQLEEYQTDRPDFSMLLSLISRNADRINVLASSLLQATRFDDLLIRPYPLAQLVEECLFVAKDRTGFQSVQIHKYFLDRQCEVLVDVPRIKIAILNVIINALEAVEDRQGLIEIWLFCEDGFGRIEIRDNGPGMEEMTIQNLFEPFFTSKGAGNGLGLTNSQNIILNHRGRILVESEAGKGAKFVLLIPTVV